MSESINRTRKDLKAGVSKKSKVYTRICCPKCNRTSHLRYKKDTVLLRFPFYCDKCKTETTIDLIDNKIYESLEPDISNK